MQKANDLLILNIIIIRSKEVTTGRNYHIQQVLEIGIGLLNVLLCNSGCQEDWGEEMDRLLTEKNGSDFLGRPGPTTGCRSICDNDIFFLYIYFCFSLPFIILPSVGSRDRKSKCPCRPRWPRGYHTCHWIWGSLVQTRPRSKDFFRA